MQKNLMPCRQILNNKVLLDIIYESIVYRYLYLQIIPAVIALFYLNKVDIYIKIFVALLWYGIVNEVLALYYGRFIGDGYNKIFYNLFNCVYFSFLFFLFYSKSYNKLIKKTLITFSVIFFIGVFYELICLKLNYQKQTQVIPYIIGGIGVLAYVGFYLTKLLISKQEEPMFANLFLWVLIAHFIYYLAFIPYKVGENYFDNFKFAYLLELKLTITVFKSIILSVGFICSRKKVQS